MEDGLEMEGGDTLTERSLQIAIIEDHYARIIMNRWEKRRRWRTDFAPRMREIMGAWLDKNLCFLPSPLRSQAWEELAGPFIKEVIREKMAVIICEVCDWTCSDRCLIFKYEGRRVTA